MSKPESKTCCDCGETKPLEQFPLLRSRQKRADGSIAEYANHLHYCKLCRNTRQRERYHADPEFRARQIVHAMACQKRVKHLPPLKKEPIVRMILNAKTCAYCHQPNDGTVRFAVDHYRPLCQGGEHTLENLRACCEPCNRAKHDMQPEQYLAWLAGAVARAS